MCIFQFISNLDGIVELRPLCLSIPNRRTKGDLPIRTHAILFCVEISLLRLWSTVNQVTKHDELKSRIWAHAFASGLITFVAGILVACLLLFLSPSTNLLFSDTLNWRFGRPSVAQMRLERSLTETQLYTDGMQSEPGTVLFGASHLHRFPPSFLTGVVSNFAISGETAVELSNRIRRYVSLHRATRIVLQSGRNDLQRGSELWRVAEAFGLMLTVLPHDVPVILIAVPPAREGVEKVRQRKALNLMIQNLCASHDNCHFVPLEVLAGSDGQLLPEYDSGDGIHLNKAGYRLLATLISNDSPPKH